MSAITVLQPDASSLHGNARLQALIHHLYGEYRAHRRVVVSLPAHASTEAALLVSALDECGVPVAKAPAHALRFRVQNPDASDWLRASWTIRDAAVVITHGGDLIADPGNSSLTCGTQVAVPPARVVLLGLGTVGLGVYRYLAQRPDLFQVQRVVVREPARHADDGVPPALFSTNPWDAINEPAQLVIEAIGGLEPAGDVVHAALLRGRDVVTANKLLVAERWATLRRFAAEPARQLRFSAAVGGGVPVLETLRELRRTRVIESVRGIVNGTCNFVLDQLERGASFAEAIASAQAHGFAEADPRADISGADAAQKLCLLAQAAFGRELRPAEIETDGIGAITAAEIERAGTLNRRIRLVARCRRTATGVHAHVGTVALAPDDYLWGARAEENRIEISTTDQRCVRLRGKGAGRWPTALAVLGDVYEVLRERSAAAPRANAAPLSR